MFFAETLCHIDQVHKYISPSLTFFLHKAHVRMCIPDFFLKHSTHKPPSKAFFCVKLTVREERARVRKRSEKERERRRW